MYSYAAGYTAKKFFKKNDLMAGGRWRIREEFEMQIVLLNEAEICIGRDVVRI